MVFLLAFWSFLIGALAIGWRAGDRHDRMVIAAIAAAAALSTAAHLLLAKTAALAAVLAVDLALLAIVARHALSSRRYWPVWFAGFQATAILFGLAAILLPEDQHLVAERVGAFWSLPALVAMMLGLIADRRAQSAGTGG